jgi:hypothetical protein
MNGDPKTDPDQLRKRWDRIRGRLTVQTESKDDVALCRKYLVVISLTLKPGGHYMYHQVNIHSNSTFSPHTVFMCFVWISEQTAIISLYKIH